MTLKEILAQEQYPSENDSPYEYFVLGSRLTLNDEILRTLALQPVNANVEEPILV